MVKMRGMTMTMMIYCRSIRAPIFILRVLGPWKEKGKGTLMVLRPRKEKGIGTLMVLRPRKEKGIGTLSDQKGRHTTNSRPQTSF
jgi:hypothetical protein